MERKHTLTYGFFFRINAIIRVSHGAAYLGLVASIFGPGLTQTGIGTTEEADMRFSFRISRKAVFSRQGDFIHFLYDLRSCWKPFSEM